LSATLSPDPVVVEGGSISDEPVFEQRGIDYIPFSERRGRPIDLAWMWAGALFNVEYVVYGALLVVATGFGLRFWQAALIIVVGNLSYLITGLGSLQGPRAGTAAFTINRAPFGPMGAKLIAVFNWMTQVGYEVVGLALVVSAGLALFDKAGVGASTGLKVGLIVAAAVVQLTLPLFGHRAMLRVLRMLVPPFVVLFILLAILTLPKANLAAGHNASWAQMMAGLAFILSSGGYGWQMNANDFSRYLPHDASPRRIVWSVALGGYVPTTLLLLLGAALATAIPGASDAISGLPHAFAGWFLWPYLVFVIVQLFAINSIDLYSSGLTLQAIIPRIKRWQCVLLDTTVAAGLTAYTVFSSNFNTFLTDFLLFMLIWIAPWVAIYLADYFMRRGRYDSRSLLDTGPGLYFRNGGVHVAGIVAQLIGMVAAASWLNAYPAWTAPLSNATGGADFSVFMGALFGAGVYWLLARRSVRQEAEVSLTEATIPDAPPA
jgi:NCS1 family nucleobase:cation symporter-1